MDAFPALAYAYGIKDKKLKEELSWVHCYDKIVLGWKVEDQIAIVQKLKRRIPNYVLEIGAGRGELACTFAKLGSKVDAVEVSDSAAEWFVKTGQHFYGHLFHAPTPIDEITDVTKYDTIVLVQTLEHLPDNEFQLLWKNIVSSFHGLVIITNHMSYHPIEIGGDWENAEHEHCKKVDDALYDQLSSDAKRVVFRQGSHLVLEF